jgi:hypothetical protein
MKILNIIIPLLLLMPLTSDAQCRAFSKNRCLPQLKGYSQSDTYNSALLAPGDVVDQALTFYAGREYRLVVCAHPILGEVAFEVTDTHGEKIFEGMACSEACDNATNKLDFKMTQTQQLIIKIKVPKTDSEFMHEGCVTIMSGFKASK